MTFARLRAALDRRVGSPRRTTTPPEGSRPACRGSPAGLLDTAAFLCPVAHPDALLRLVGLALGLDRRRDHELRLLELLDRLVPGRRHRGRERTEQVERAVVLVGRTGEDLLDRGD